MTAALGPTSPPTSSGTRGTLHLSVRWPTSAAGEWTAGLCELNSAPNESGPRTHRVRNGSFTQLGTRECVGRGSKWFARFRGPKVLFELQSCAHALRQRNQVCRVRVHVRHGEVNMLKQIFFGPGWFARRDARAKTLATTRLDRRCQVQSRATTGAQTQPLLSHSINPHGDGQVGPASNTSASVESEGAPDYRSLISPSAAAQFR